MKKYLLILLVAFTAIAANAASPALATARLFSEKNITNPKVRATIVNADNNYYRSIEVVDDAALVRQIEAAISADRHHAYNQVENYNNGIKSEILQISRDNAMVSIGFDKQSDTKCTVYIHSTKRSAVE